MNRYPVVLLLILLSPTVQAQPNPSPQAVNKSLHRAVTFFRQHAAAGGGYIYQLSADLQKREGEGRVSSTVAWRPF